MVRFRTAPLHRLATSRVYGIGRCFNEASAAAVRPRRFAADRVDYPVNFSDVRHVSAHASDAQLLDVLMSVAGEHPDKKLVLMANHDIFSAFVAATLGHSSAPLRAPLSPILR